ncbi:unnamed protein product, partial [Effrenium voratum]
TIYISEGAIYNLKLTQIMKALFDDVYTISNYCSWPNFVWDYWVIYDFHSTVYRRTAEICYKAVTSLASYNGLRGRGGNRAGRGKGHDGKDGLEE